MERLDVMHSDLEKECLKILRKLAVKIHFIFKGKPYKGIAAGLILLTCRKLNLPVRLRQIVKASGIKFRIIYKCINVMKLHVPETCGYVSKPINFLKKIAQKLRFSEENFNFSKEILSLIESHPARKSAHATTLAGCAIFLTFMIKKEITNIKLGHQLLSHIANISEVSRNTIRNMYDGFHSCRKELLAINAVNSEAVGLLPLL